MKLTRELEKSRENGGEDVQKIRDGFISVLQMYAQEVEVPSFPLSGLVLIGGGSGIPTVGRSLYRKGVRSFTSVASVMDVGGGSGFVQDAFGIPHMNDVAQHLLRTNPSRCPLAEFIDARSSNSWRQDGYLVLAAAVELFGVERGIDYISAALKNTHRSLPITGIPCEPIFTYGGCEYDTHAFAYIPGRRGVASDVSLNRAATPLPGVIAAIQNAETIILGPGDVHFSILPPLLIPSVIELMDSVRRIVLVANLTARRIDIPGFSLRDLLNFWKRRLPRKPEYYVLVNSLPVVNQKDPALADDIPGDEYGNFHIYRAPLAGKSISRNEQLLHDEDALGNALCNLLKQ